MRQEAFGDMCRRTSMDEQIARCVQFALQGTSTTRTHDERRRQKRHPFPYPVRLIPVDARGEAAGQPIVVIGKHLTNQGFDFYFQHPVSYRRVIACFDCESSERVEILMDLAWCRFSVHGWYENGGRFLAAVNLPADRSLNLVAHEEAVVSSGTELDALCDRLTQT